MPPNNEHHHDKKKIYSYIYICHVHAFLRKFAVEIHHFSAGRDGKEIKNGMGGRGIQ